MASRSHPVACLLLVTIVISLTAVADSASARPPATKPMEVYPGCSEKQMPKRCSASISKLLEIMAETKATIAGPHLAAKKLKTDSCITGCAKVADEAASKATAAKKDAEGLSALSGYVSEKVLYNDGPIGPCECNCPEPCSADESAAVKKLGEATKIMTDLADLLGGGNVDEDKAAEMEKSMDSGVLHVSCGLTKEPQKCSDELSALVKTTEEAKSAAKGLQEKVKPSPALDSVINDCSGAVDSVNEELYYAAREAKRSLAKIRATLRSDVKGDGNKPPLCKYSCPPPPPEKPCSANETVIVDKLTGIYNAWVAAEKFLTELLPVKAKKAPK